jgi:hypothetical protein
VLDLRTGQAQAADLGYVVGCTGREARSSPLAHRSARVIGTDALYILLVSPEPSDGEEHKQDTKDDPNINAHQSSSPPPVRTPRKARIA